MYMNNNAIYLAIYDGITMFKRCMILSFRNIEAVFLAILSPVLMMMLFVYVLGGAMNIGDTEYINYIVPGIVLQAIGQSALTTAVRVNEDMQGGIMNRFKSMPINKTALLIAHAFSAVLRSMVSTIIIFIIAFFMGFKPMADFGQWCMVIVLLFLTMMTIAWICILFGLIARTSESASGLSVIISVLPYFSSGFVPTETMPYFLRIFAQNQPITSIVESLRALLMNAPENPNAVPALLWCIGVMIVAIVLSLKRYGRKS